MDVAIKVAEGSYILGSDRFEGKRVIVFKIENIGLRPIKLYKGYFRLKMKGKKRVINLLPIDELFNNVVLLEPYDSRIIEFNTYDKFISQVPINAIDKPFYLSPIGKKFYGKLSKSLK